MISIVTPVYSEESALPHFYKRCVATLEPIGEPFEIVFVDDGSRDSSLELLRDLAASDSRVRVVALSRNFGHQLAITAGLDHARGDAVVILDSDLQDPPEVIAAMIDKWREGYKVVYGVRTERPGENWAKLALAKWFYRTLSRLSDTPLPLDSGDFRLMDRQVVDILRTMREDSRYLRGMVSWVGFRQCGVSYEREVRHSGEVKYTFRKSAKLASDGITSFSDRPLRLATQLGVAITTVSFLYAAWVLISTLADPHRAFKGYASLLAAVLFLGGVQLLSIGILGSYLGRVYRQSKQRPLYVVAEEFGDPR